MVFVEWPPDDYQAGDEHLCGLLQNSLYGARDAAQNFEEELALTLSDQKLTRGGSRAHVCGMVASSLDVSWQQCTDVAPRLAENGLQWNSLSKYSRPYEMKEHVLGEDANQNLKSRNQVRSRRHHDRGGSEALFTDIWKDLDLERATHASTQCTNGRRNEDNARSGWSNDRNSAKPSTIRTMRVMADDK